MAPPKAPTLRHFSAEETPLRRPPHASHEHRDGRTSKPQQTRPRRDADGKHAAKELHKNQRAWEEKYRAAHAEERALLERARRERPRPSAAEGRRSPRPQRASEPRAPPGPTSGTRSAPSTPSAPRPPPSTAPSARRASGPRVRLRTGAPASAPPVPDLPLPELFPVPKAPPSLLSSSRAGDGNDGYATLHTFPPPPPPSEPSPSSSSGAPSLFSSPPSRTGGSQLRHSSLAAEASHPYSSSLSLSRMVSAPDLQGSGRASSSAPSSQDAGLGHRLSRLSLRGRQEPESRFSDATAPPHRSRFHLGRRPLGLTTPPLPGSINTASHHSVQRGTYTAPPSPGMSNPPLMPGSASTLSGYAPKHARSLQGLVIPPGGVGYAPLSAGLLDDEGDYTSEGSAAKVDSSSDESDWDEGPTVKWSPYQAQIEDRIANADRHQGQGGKREVGDILLLGPAAAAGSSRRPPEYDTGGMSGKESKITWVPWKHLTRGGEDIFSSPGEEDVVGNASSLVVHARFAVFAVSGSTVLTAHNHKVKIFRAGTVRAEVAGMNLGDPRAPGSASGSTTNLPGTSPIQPEKVATIQDPDMAMEGRVTALCFLRPSGNEEGSRYAWVGTRSGMLWELDVTKEVRTAVNRTVHKVPIVRIARLGDRILVVDEGGKMSIWTPPRPGTAPSVSGYQLSSEATSRTSLGARSSVSVNVVREPLDKDDAASIRSSRPPSALDKYAADKAFESTCSTRLLNTRPATQRFQVEGKTCVPLLVGKQMWVATGGAVLGSYHASEPGSTAQGSGHRHKHSLPRSFRKSVRAAASHVGTDHALPNAAAATLRDIKLLIFSPFADEQPSTPPPALPPILPSLVAGTVIGPVTAAAVVPNSPSTAFLSHTTGHVSEWSRESYQYVAVHQHSPDAILCMTAVGRYLWAGTKGGKILVFGLSEESKRSPGCRLVVIKSWVAHGGNPVTRLVTDPDGVTLGRLQVVSGGMDGAVRVWDGMLAHDWFERRLRRASSDWCTSRSIRTLHVTYNIDAADPVLLRSPRAGPENQNFLQDLLRSAGRAPSVTYDAADGGQVKPVGPEVIVFGLQELIDLEDKRLTAKSLLLGKRKFGNELGERISNQYSAWRTALIAAVAEAFGEGKYRLVESELLVGLMTCVFVATAEVKAGNLAETAVGTVKTGLGGRYGNKGAVAARVVLDDTSLCFVNCHLAAGQRQVQARNNDAATILTSTKLFPKSAAAASTVPLGPNTGDGPLPSGLRRSLAFTRGGDGEQVLDHEIVFWSGDLNYRINLTRDETLGYLTSGNIAALQDVDQLGEQSCERAAFALRAFYESKITFPPTYKFNHLSQVYDTSAKQRVPAWCDRILWCDAAQTFPSSCVRIHDAQDDEQADAHLGALHSHKSPLLRPRAKQVEGYAYRSWPPTISDHRPVSSQFEVELKRIDPSRLAKLVPRLRKEWALVQARHLTQAKDFFETSILG